MFAAGIPCFVQSQSTWRLDKIVVTAKSLEKNLPQQLTQYGTHLDTISAAQIQNGGCNQALAGVLRSHQGKPGKGGSPM